MSLDKIVWDILLEGGHADDSDDIKFQFTDTSNILGEPVISDNFMIQIIDLARVNSHYSVLKNMKQIISDKGEVVKNAALWLLMGVVKQNSQRVGLLLGSLENGGIHVIGSWPDTFTDQLRTDTSLVDIVLNNFISTPDFWNQVDLILGKH